MNVDFRFGLGRVVTDPLVQPVSVPTLKPVATGPTTTTTTSDPGIIDKALTWLERGADIFSTVKNTSVPTYNPTAAPVAPPASNNTGKWLAVIGASAAIGIGAYLLTRKKKKGMGCPPAGEPSLLNGPKKKSRKRKK